MNDRLIYLDNAATTFPKPREVLEEMLETYIRIGVSPGRGSYDMAVQAEEIVYEKRKQLAVFFGAPDPNRVIFTANATDALNLIFAGLLQPGDHVVSTRLEHNSVLRPLHHFHERSGVTYDLVSFDSRGFVDPQEIERSIKPNTRCVVVTHASNVLGTVQPAPEIGKVCADRGIPFIVDASQSAGTIPIDMMAWHVSALAFTGHKALYGPTGIGGLVLHPEMDIGASRFGGTGVDSKSLVHTSSYPHRLESGTINLMGIIGLSAGIDYILKKGMPSIHRQEMALLNRLRDGLAELKHVRLYGDDDLSNHVAVLSANVEGMSSRDVGDILDGDFNIAVRVGLHCAPLVHRDLGTINSGAVRFSLGVFNTQEDIDQAIRAMASMRTYSTGFGKRPQAANQQ
ncbi:MAG: aminotransferase class V-fold PLP-dependent enzyme [Deltaproteobacteria bacterium]|nr:aminotransferase class V-fold PLP-dependent enzyme [Deltaproteobacteria bacterium]